MDNSQSHVTQQPSLMVGALTRLLRPLIKLLIHYQVTYPMLSELLKSVYIDVAQSDFRLADKRMTDSRISILTGVHRKDIRKSHAVDNSSSVEPAAVSLGTQLISIWMSDSRYTNKQGKAKPLKRVGRGKRDMSFESLVQSVGRRDIHARSVLDDWLRLGVVELSDNDEVVLRQEAFVPAKGFDEKAFYLGQNVHDHIGAVANNIMGQTQPMLERSVYYGDLSQESVEELHDLAREVATKALKAVDKKARELKEKDGASRASAGRFRMNFGSYFYNEPVNNKEDDGDV
jgi:hypothetical protein